MTQQFITQEAGSRDAWICVCGNVPHDDGFYPCDKTGNEMEPALHGAAYTSAIVAAELLTKIRSKSSGAS